MRLAGAYLAVAGTLLVLDGGWLGFAAFDFYVGQLGALLASRVNVAAALVYFTTFIIGVVVFAVVPALEAKDASRALQRGALLGLVMFAAFDMAALAVINGFPPILAAVDLLWGVVLTAVAARAGYAAVA